MLARKVPAQVPTALGALAIRPGMARKPRILKCGDAGLVASEGFGKGDDVKTNPFRVRECKLVFAFEAEPVSLIRHSLVAPGA